AKVWRSGAGARANGQAVPRGGDPAPDPSRGGAAGGRPARQPFIGFSLGIEWEPERAARAHISDIAIAHAGADRRVVGGLTLRPRLIRQRPSGRGRPTRA